MGAVARIDPGKSIPSVGAAARGYTESINVYKVGKEANKAVRTLSVGDNFETVFIFVFPSNSPLFLGRFIPLAPSRPGLI
jgi:hypothetical protein